VRFYGLVMRDAAGLGQLRRASGMRGRVARAPTCQVDDVNFYVFSFFLALVDGVGEQGELAAVRRNKQSVDAQRGRSNCIRAWSEIFGFFLGISLHLCRRGGVTGKGCGHVEGEDRIAALGHSILHYVFPNLLVLVLLRLRPGLAGGEVNCLRIRGPRKRMDFFLALSHREGFAAVR
jgi:hypothetical protein